MDNRSNGTLGEELTGGEGNAGGTLALVAINCGAVVNALILGKTVGSKLFAACGTAADPTSIK